MCQNGSNIVEELVPKQLNKHFNPVTILDESRSNFFG